MNTAAIAAAAWATSLAIAAWLAYGAGQDAAVADQARTEAAVVQAGERAASAAADAISRITVRHQTVRQELQREIIDRPVYRDCRSGPDAVRLFNAALPTDAASAPAADSGILPAAHPDGG